MARFEFKLEKVLALKKRKEQEKEKEFAELKKLLVKEERFHEELKAEAGRINGKVEDIQTEKGVEKLDLRELLRYYDYLEGLRKRVSLQVTQIRKLMEDIEKKRVDLLEASKERKILEKLRDNQYKKFKDRVDEVERKFLDDIGTMNYNQKGMLWKQ